MEKTKTVTEGYCFSVNTNIVEYTKLVYDFLVKHNTIVKLIETNHMKIGDDIDKKGIVVKRKKYDMSIYLKYENEGVVVIQLYDTSSDKMVGFWAGHISSRDADSDPNDEADIDYRYMTIHLNTPAFEMETNCYYNKEKK